MAAPVKMASWPPLETMVALAVPPETNS